MNGVDVGAQVRAAMRKAQRKFPGVVGEALATQLDYAWAVQTLLAPGSLSARLLAAIESLPEPGDAP